MSTENAALSQALLKQIPRISSKKLKWLLGKEDTGKRPHTAPPSFARGRKGSDSDSKIITYQIDSLFVHSSTDKNEVRRWMGDEAFTFLNVLVSLFTAKKGEK